MKLLFLTNGPAPYRVDFFNELGKYIDLTVLFEELGTEKRDISWKQYKFNSFRGIFLKNKTDTVFCPEVITYLKETKYDFIICANFTSLTGMLAIGYMRHHQIKYYLESDGGFAKSGHGFKEKLKKYFIKEAEGYFSTGSFHDDYYLAYGAERHKIIRYPYTSLKTEDILKVPVDKSEKHLLRKKLGISEEKMVLTVGQFIPRKGFDVLLQSAKSISKEVGIYFIGGDTEKYLQIQKENNLCNVHYIGFKSKRELIEYYKSADVFVLPTREDIWGLVVNEAMAYGLPIISTSRCGAALELVKGNGYIVDVGDSRGLADKIQLVLNNELIRSKFAEKSLEIIHKYTIEEMVKSHLEAFA